MRQAIMKAAADFNLFTKRAHEVFASLHKNLHHSSLLSHMKTLARVKLFSVSQ